MNMPPLNQFKRFDVRAPIQRGVDALTMMQ